MIQHQIVVKDAREFPVAEPANEPADLTWFLLRLGAGWVLISSDFGYVELIPEATVSQATVEHAVFTIIRRHCNDTNLEQCVGLTANHVKWSATSALPAVIKHRLKQVKAIVAKAGSLDEAGQRIAKLNQRDFVDSERGSPANMLGVRLYSACKEPVKHNTFKLLGRYLVLRVQLAWLRWLR